MESRFHSHAEDLIYSGGSIRYGFRSNIELGLRGSFAGTSNYLLPFETLAKGRDAQNNIIGREIGHGGSDIELYGKYSLANSPRYSLAGIIGATFPSTPAQSHTLVTVGAAGSLKLSDRITAYINPRAVLLTSNSIVGIGGGLTFRLSDHLTLIGDFTAIVSGFNTRSLDTGDKIKRDVWGGAIRWSKGSDFALDIGFGNALGSTTGSSLTSSLGGDGAIFVAITLHK